MKWIEDIIAASDPEPILIELWVPDPEPEADWDETDYETNQPYYYEH